MSFQLFCVTGYQLNKLSNTFQRRLTIDHIRKFLRELLSAVDYLHSKSIVHRDLKPGNILIKVKDVHPSDPSWISQDVSKMSLAVTDFGFAKQLDSEESRLMTRVYTPGPSAPEIEMAKFNGLKSEDGKPVDMYQIGLIAFQMYEGKNKNAKYWDERKGTNET